MRCTECSQEVKPVVAVDIDGTLCDYHNHFLNFACLYLGEQAREEWSYDGSVKFREWAVKEFGITEDVWHDIKLAYRQGAQKRSAPVFPGAVNLCQAVRRRGGELWVTTTRPYMRLDNVDPDTREWLQRHGIKYDGLLYDRSKYERLASMIDPGRVVAILEDLPYQVEFAKAEFGNGIPMYRRNDFNRAVSVSGVPDVFDLREAEDMIVQRIETWKDSH